MVRLYFVFVLFSYCNFLTAQEEFCLTEKIWAEMARHDSSLYYKRESEDKIIAQTSNMSGKRSEFFSSGNQIIIPTVIYIIYDNAFPASNISMQQIQSQMDQLNAGFDSVGIQFCYAKRSVTDTSFFIPQTGDSAGIFRINSPLSNVDQHTQDSQLKNLSGLPSQTYLRIFVVNSINPTGVLGYALYPGTNFSLDGIVIRSDVFGSQNFCGTCNLLSDYKFGATLIHEVGHYLNLYHTFQGGCVMDTGLHACQLHGDYICDTPPTTGNYGCPFPIPLSCDSTVQVKIENYMDYTNDVCKNSFTNGQQLRMEQSIYTYRSQLISIQNLIKTGVTCTAIDSQYANFNCPNFNGCLNRSMTFESLGSPGFIYTWDFGDSSFATGDTVQHTYSAIGQYSVKLFAINTSQNISTSSSIIVFITECFPVNCSVNKWSFEYGYMDFSSGTPVAVNHTTLYPNPTFADFYHAFYYADSAGNPLFHISPQSGLLDSSFNIVDTIGGLYACITPVPGHSNMYCVLSDSSNLKMVYSILDVNNGAVYVVPGKRQLNLSFPGMNQISNCSGTGIPSCDGTNFWFVISHYGMDGIYVFKLDSSETITFHQYYPVSLLFSEAVYNQSASPDGKKIVVRASNGNVNFVLMFKFDKVTGSIIGYDTIAFSNTTFYGHGCFSPNSRFYYLPEYSNTTGNRNPYMLYQYDLFSSDPFATRKLINHRYLNSNFYGSGICIGPDRKLYIGIGSLPSLPEFYRLAVINYPDVLDNGLNCVGFNLNGPDMKPAGCPYTGIDISGFSAFAYQTEAYGCDWKLGEPSRFNFFAESCFNYHFFSDDCFSHRWNFGDPASGINNTSTLSNPIHLFSGAGNYVITLEVKGVTFTDTVKIELSPLQIAQSGLNNCLDLQGNYSVIMPQSNTTYSWYVSNGVPTFVPSGTDIDVLWNDTSTSNIKVVAVNMNSGCIDSIITSVDFGNCNPTSVLSMIAGNEISIHPNPSQESFLLNSSKHYNGKLEFRMMNMLSQIIQEKIFYLNNEPLNIFINVKVLPVGIYYVMLKIENAIILKRIVID
jgi:PKD repeat protein